jgi:Lipid A 3-O-deacylase (PagL)
VRLAVVVFAVSVFWTLMPSIAAAQADTVPANPWPRWEIGPYVGAARHSLVGTHFGVIPDRDHFFLGIDVTFNVVRRARWAFGFAPEVLPLVIVSNNPTYRTISAGRDRFIVEDGRGPVTGFGVSPIALQGQVKVTSRLRLYAAGAMGAVWFTRDVPVIDSRAFNYTFEWGGGLRWQVRHREALRFGCKFHHLSNAYSAPQNPGLDAAVLLIGYEHSLASR